MEKWGKLGVTPNIETSQSERFVILVTFCGVPIGILAGLLLDTRDLFILGFFIISEPSYSIIIWTPIDGLSVNSKVAYIIMNLLEFILLSTSILDNDIFYL